MEKIELNTDVLADMSGKVTEQSLRMKLPALDAEAYRGKHVVVKGCAPTWAVMQLQHRLEGVAASLSFKLFDGKEIGVW